MTTTQRWIGAMLMLCPALAIADPGTDAAAQEVRFQFKPVVGAEAQMRVTTQTFGSIAVPAPLPAQKFSQSWEQELALKCLRINDDGTSVHELRMPNITMKMNIGGLTMEFDTRRPGEQSASHARMAFLSDMFQSLTDSTYTLTLGPDGEPLKVEGFSQAMDKAVDALGSQMKVPGLKGMLDQFKEYLTDDMIAENLRSSYRVVPDDNRARVGDVWERQWRIPVPFLKGTMEATGQYELLAVEEYRGRPCAKIRVKSTLIMTPDEPAQDAPDSKKAKSIFDRMDMKLSSTGGNGLAYWDYQTGELVDMRETQRIVVEISFGADPTAEPEEMKAGFGKIVEKLTTSVHMELLGDNESGAAARPASTDGQSESQQDNIARGNR